MSFELDWFPLYADKLLASRKVRRMKAKEFGIFLALLVESWLEGGPLPDDDEELCDAGRAPIKEVRKVLDKCFLLNGDGWSNKVLEDIRTEQLSKRRKRQAAGAKGGKARPLEKQNPSEV